MTLMTLDEAIAHAEYVADYDYYGEAQCKCAEEHRQLAEWLKELKYRRSNKAEWHFEEWPDGYYHSECSRCGHYFIEDAFLTPYNYCPNCGADMKGLNK